MTTKIKIGLFFSIIALLSVLYVWVVSYPSWTEKVAYKSNKSEIGPIQHVPDGVVYKNSYLTTTDLYILKGSPFEVGGCYEQFSELIVTEDSVVLKRSDKIFFTGEPLGLTADQAGLICRDFQDSTRVVTIFRIILDKSVSREELSNQGIVFTAPGEPNAYLFSPSAKCPKIK